MYQYPFLLLTWIKLKILSASRFMERLTNKLPHRRAAGYQSEYQLSPKERVIRPSSASGGFKPQILLKITNQKHTWSPAKKSKEPSVDLTPSHVELFFKWIKQHLRIKSFYGTSENAIKTQIWIAISIYVLVAIVKKELKLDHSLYTILQVLSVTLFEKEPILQVLTNNDYMNPNPAPSKQLNLFE